MISFGNLAGWLQDTWNGPKPRDDVFGMTGFPRPLPMTAQVANSPMSMMIDGQEVGLGQEPQMAFPIPGQNVQAGYTPVERGMIAPLGTYHDGSTGFAVPGMLGGFGIDALGRSSQAPMGSDRQWQALADAGFEFAGSAVTGGLGLGLAGGLADNAVGAAGGRLGSGALERAGGQKLAPDLWHGTNNIFEQFDLAQAGSAGQGSFMGKNGVYLSPDPLGASGYGRYLMRVEPQFQNPHIMPTTNMDLQLSDDYTRSLLDAGHDAVIMRLMDRDRETGEVLSAYDQEVFAMRPEQLVIKEIIDQDAKNVDLYDIPRSLFGWLGGPYYK